MLCCDMPEQDKRIITEEMFAEMKDDYLVKKMSHAKIALKFNLKTNRVKYLFFVKYSITRKKKKTFPVVERTFDELKKLVIKKIKENKSINRISEELVVSKYWVIKIVEENNLVVHNPRISWTNKRKREFIEMFNRDGKEIAAKYYRLTKKYTGILFCNFTKIKS